MNERFPHIAMLVFMAYASLFASSYVMAVTTDEEEWDIWFVPYVWGLSMDGDARIGEEAADVDVGFSDILKDLNFAAMGFLDARKGKVGYFFNPIVSRVKADESAHGHEIDVTNDTAIIAAGAYYRVYETNLGGSNGGSSRRFILEPYAGARWTYMRAEIDAKNVAQIDKSESWLDPIIGSRMLIDLTSKWDVGLAADVGGFGVGSDFSWNAQALFGYRFKLGQRDAIFRFGYRALYQDYDTGSGSSRFKWDVTQHGPIAGLALRF